MGLILLIGLSFVTKIVRAYALRAESVSYFSNTTGVAIAVRGVTDIQRTEKGLDLSQISDDQFSSSVDTAELERLIQIGQVEQIHYWRLPDEPLIGRAVRERLDDRSFVGMLALLNS